MHNYNLKNFHTDTEEKQENDEHSENWSFNISQSRNYEDSRNMFANKYQVSMQDSDINGRICNNELIFEG